MGLLCFDGDTRVQVAPQVALATRKATGKASRNSKVVPAPQVAANTKKIKDLRVGDLVASRNPRTGKTEYTKVTQLFQHHAAQLVAVGADGYPVYNLEVNQGGALSEGV